MMPEDKEILMREIHTAYMHGIISRQQSMEMMKMANQEPRTTSYTFPTHEVITGTFEFSTEEYCDGDNFTLRGAL